MRAAGHTPAFDHGAALRVPPPEDTSNWRNLLSWLGDDGARLSGRQGVEVYTPDGPVRARPGDWVVLSVSGRFHVARSGPALRLVE
jgi:hypothetical protein